MILQQLNLNTNNTNNNNTSLKDSELETIAIQMVELNKKNKETLASQMINKILLVLGVDHKLHQKIIKELSLPTIDIIKEEKEKKKY